MTNFPIFESRSLSAVAAATLCALASCSQPSEVGDNTVQPQETVAADAVTNIPPAAVPTPAPTASVPEPVPSGAADGETVGGDGSQIRLTPLSEKDMAGATLSGELACSFGRGRDTLLLAKGDVGSKERAWGVIKVGDYVEQVSAPGGYDGMLRDATFAGKGTTLKLALTGPATGGGESPPRPATLTYLRADGASRLFRGNWTCGP